MFTFMIDDHHDVLQAANQIIAFQAREQGVEPEWLWHPNDTQLTWHPDMYSEEYIDEIESHSPGATAVRITTACEQIVIRNIFSWRVLGPSSGSVGLRYYVAKALRNMITPGAVALIEVGIDFETAAGIGLDIVRANSSRRCRRTTTTTRRIRREGGTK